MERNKKMKKSKLQEAGITLVALVVTIIVLLILAGISIRMVLGQNGVIERARDSKNVMNEAQIKEEIKLAWNAIQIDGITKGWNNETKSNALQIELKKEDNSATATLTDTNIKVTYKGYEITINVNDGSMTQLAKVNVEPANPSSLVTITSENVNDYLGKIVTNYKTPNSTETITIDGVEQTVSTTYRLFYVDFDNKYGDGTGTVYLKADFGNNSINLYNNQSEFIPGNVSATSKFLNLNPMIKAYSNTNEEEYEEEISMEKHKVSGWLLDTNKWNALVTSGNNTSIASKVKYAVGAATIEMYMDSYNTRYNLLSTEVDTSERTSDSPRSKLACRYRPGGYQYAPCVDDEGYSIFTERFAVISDTSDGNMYRVQGNICYLASPADYDDESTMVGINGDFEERRCYNRI